jgi:hypothetical protein
MTQILKASAMPVLSGTFVDVPAEREAEAEAQATTEKPAMAAAQEAKLLAATMIPIGRRAALR